MKENIFSLARVGSNDTSLEKMNPLTVRIYDINTSRVVTHFIDICCITGPRGGTAEFLTKYTKFCKNLKFHGATVSDIPWITPVQTRELETRENQEFLEKTTIAIFFGALVISSMIHHMQDRQRLLKFQDLTLRTFALIYIISLIKASNTHFCNQEYRKILKHLNVRWVSLELAVDRSLKLYVSLKLYFLSEKALTTGGKSEFGGLKRFEILKKAFEVL